MTRFPLPPHVRADQLLDFDIYGHEAKDGDLHRGLMAIYADAPDIFWTPRNGGHWVVTRSDAILRITADTTNFSTRVQNIPKTEGDYRLIPLNLDPPENLPYRAMLMKLFSARAVAGLDGRMRGWAGRLIDEVAAAGTCDLARVGARFPVAVFMDILGLPLDRIDDFRAMVVAYFGFLEPQARLALQARIAAEMDAVIAARRIVPREDVISDLLALEIRGRALTGAELQSICFTLFLAGLDTVANSIVFAFSALAGDQELQARLAADPARSADFVDEAMRRSTIANTVRLVLRDTQVGDATMKAGEMVLCALPAVGLDARLNADPMRFDIDRSEREQIAFSPGPHLCIGHHLARAEMRIFVEEWLARIPRFGIAAHYEPDFRPGTVMQLRNLALEWETG